MHLWFFAFWAIIKAYEKEKAMKNRHGDEYSFEHLGNNIYKFVMGGTSMRYCRMGGFEGQDVVDHTSLSYFDPAGGPFIGIGDKLSIGTVKHIKSSSEGFMIEVHA